MQGRAVDYLMKFNYLRALKSFLWGIAGLIISLPIIASKGFFLFGYPLFVLSLLMFALSSWQFYKDNKR
jgi:hypothetical protein